MKATAIKFYIRGIGGSLSELVNARQEISNSLSGYNKFIEVSKDEFIEAVDEGCDVCCIESKSGRFYEVGRDDLIAERFNI